MISFKKRKPYTDKKFNNPSSKIAIARPKKEKLVRQKIKSKKTFKRRGGFPKIRINKDKITVVALSIIILSVSFALVFYKRDALYIHSVMISETSYLNESYTSKLRQDYANQFFFFIYPRKVEREIIDSSPYIINATVTKTLPDKLDIKIVERAPLIILANRVEVNLIATDGIVVERLVDYEDFKLTREELDILTGQFSLEKINLENEDEIKEPEIADEMTEEEIEDLNIEYEEKLKLRRDEKKAILNSREEELESRLNDFWIESLADIDREQYVIVYSYSDTKYKLGQSVDVDFPYLIDLASEVSRIKSLGEFESILWISDLEIHLSYNYGRYVVVSTDEKKEVKVLYDEVLTVIEDLKKKGEDFTKIDVRGNSIVVGRD